MKGPRRSLTALLVGVLVLSVTVPLPGWSAAALGTARGVRGGELSLDSGKTWLPLGGRSLPVMDGSQIRTTSSAGLLDLTDGSRIHVLPFSTVRVRESGTTTEVSVPYGRLTFGLPAGTRVEIRTPSARLEPVRTGVMAGELVVGGEGALGLKMFRGSLRVQELSGARRVMLAGADPVFLPRPPAAPRAFFAADAPAAPPADARAVFSPKGESLGYLRSDGQLVIHPGFTADLTGPFPTRLLEVAMAKVPVEDRPHAMPLFDVNGRYVGYLAGPVFYADMPTVAGAAAASGGLPTAAWLALGALTAAGGVLMDDCLAGGGLCETEASPLRPRR